MSKVKTCDTCEHGCLLGQGALLCDLDDTIRIDYNFGGCNKWEEE